MIGWKAKRSQWQQLSGHQQVETSTRWLVKSYPWAMFLGFGFQIWGHLDDGQLTSVVSTVVCVLGVVQCWVGMGAVNPALDCYLGKSTVSRGRLASLVGLLATETALAVWLVALGKVRGDMTVAMVLYGASASLTLVLGLIKPRGTALLVLGCYALVSASCLAVAGETFPEVLATTMVLAVSAVAGVFTGRSSGWYIAVMRRLDDAREAQARLAVAEERLRFSRDLHDVMGRNLSVIALKSELAAQLAQRVCDKPDDGPGALKAAIGQMGEVQRLARDSQSEVRQMVRGYRETGLPTELAGARGVLRAAGVDCRVDSGECADLPAVVQSALGWVVRESATNVLRHADASRCTVSVGTDREGRTARLVMENDGAKARAGNANGSAPPAGWSEGGGSGLRGLHKRLAALGGTLTTEREVGPGTFRLIAEVPLPVDRPPGPPWRAAPEQEDGDQGVFRTDMEREATGD